MSVAPGRLQVNNATPDRLAAAGSDAIEHDALSNELTHAAAAGDVERVNQLLDCGADVNTKRHDGFTPLLLAAFFGRFDVVRLLVQRGANVGLTSRFGTSAEMWATARGFSEIAKFLRTNVASSSSSIQLSPPEPETEAKTNEIEDQDLQIPEPLLRLNELALDGEVTLLRRSSSDPLFVDETNQPDVESKEESVAQDIEIEPRIAPRILDDSWEPYPLVALSTVQHRPGTVFAERITERLGTLVGVALAVIIASGLVTYAILKRERRLANQSSIVATTPIAEPVKTSNSEPLEQVNTVDPASNNQSESSLSEPSSETSTVDDSAYAANVKQEAVTVTRKQGPVANSARELSYHSLHNAAFAKRNERSTKLVRNQPEVNSLADQTGNERRNNVSLSQPSNVDNKPRETYNSQEIISPNRKSKVIQWP